MTENKRFNPVHKQMANVLGYECVFDDLENKWLFIRDVIILVNKLNDENEELKKENQELERKVKSMAKELRNCEEDYIYEEF